jgi:hypothetical protein
MKTKVLEAVKNLELQNKKKIIYEFKHTPDLREIGKYSLSPSQVPAVIINGNLEFAGNVEMGIIKMKLQTVDKY